MILLKLNIAYLYPELLNIYGDKGNILAFVNRCLWRNIDAEIHEIHPGNKIDPDLYDFYFIGGGQDEQQIAVADELQKQKEALTQARDNMAVFLTICGGYQLLGHYYKPHAGDELRGISLLDVYTVAGNTRYIGNVTVELNKDLNSIVNTQTVILSEAKNLSNDLQILRAEALRMTMPVNNNNAKIIVGFENHSGLTYLQGDTKPMGLITTGNGNNGKDKTEGAFYKNVFGTYLHGSFLPKNPHFTDYLIRLALERNYGKVELEPLNDEIEWTAHKKAVGRKY
ncbi:MAG TPA: glutamine amidotransferase [Cyanobacteria bacterium UBA9971]|nr:glutamine amidotransferase [Cyanobacteria bacterium UBA9971]